MKGRSVLFENSSGLAQFDTKKLASSSIKGFAKSSSPLNGNSQPYAEQYSIYSKMKQRDIANGIYKPKIGYVKNPTAQELDTLVNGNYIVGKNFNKIVPYVITTDNKVIIGSRNGNGRTASKEPTPHPTLIGGADPKVKMAGMLDIRGGKIYSYDNQSGHYRPNSESIKWADKTFEKFPKHKKYKGGK